MQRKERCNGVQRQPFQKSDLCTASARYYIADLCKNGCYVIVDSDAHFCDKIGAFKKAEALLKDIDFPEELIVNADLERFENFLRLRGIKTNAEIEPDED